MTDSLLMRATSLAGLGVLVALAWCLSENRRLMPWRLVFWGVALQFAFGVIVLRTAAGRWFFDGVRAAFDLLTAASTAGAEFVFGNLTRFFLIQSVVAAGADGQMAAQASYPVSAVVAFNVLPTIILVAGVAGILTHLGVVQVVIRAIAWVMQRTLKTSGAETFAAALQIFTGIESAAAYGEYMKKMTRSELFVVEVSFLASIAASVMVAYASFGAEPGHLLAASFMSAPAAIVLAKIMIPETGVPETCSATHRFEITIESENVFYAAARGASTGLTMALNVGAMLIVFIGLIHLVDMGTVRLCGMHVNVILGWAFRPFAVLMGVAWADVPRVGELLATKTVFNEFIAYQNMQPMIEQHLISPRSAAVATYALCGFSNPGSVGIMIGGLSCLAPERRGEIAAMSLRALAAGTIATFMMACVAGVLTVE